ncbi:MAG: ATP-grasp domain-containing protein [Clostridia bacterium]|nr:ATP-grasp domain-containing protein [Clostridia bacterium]
MRIHSNTAKSTQTVAVLFGGPSFEHEISILTGVFVLNVLKPSPYEILPVYIDTAGEFYTSPDMFDVKNFLPEKRKKFTKIFLDKKTVYPFEKKRKPLAQLYCAFNCCHGGWGEGGGVSALMEVYGVPLVSPDTALSALFMDKLRSKPLLMGMGIPCVRYVGLREGEFSEDKTGNIEKIEAQMGYPVIVKPARLGSSIGVGVARERAELITALETAFSFDGSALIEEYLPDKRDVNCAAYSVDGEIVVSDCQQPVSQEEIFSFREKYLADGKISAKNSPPPLPEGVENEIKEITKTLYKTLQFTGMVRADFLLSGDKVYFNEMNTVPGSLAYYLFSEKLLSARKIFCELIEDAVQRAKKAKKDFSFTCILNQVDFASAKSRGK